MGYYLGGEYFETDAEKQPPDDAGICYDPECDPPQEHCDNCGAYIGEEAYEKYGGLCYHCREPL